MRGFETALCGVRGFAGLRGLGPLIEGTHLSFRCCRLEGF